jgi:hypothetical protein
VAAARASDRQGWRSLTISPLTARNPAERVETREPFEGENAGAFQLLIRLWCSVAIHQGSRCCGMAKTADVHRACSLVSETQWHAGDCYLLVPSMPWVKAVWVLAEFLAQLLLDGHRAFGPGWCWRPGRTRCLLYDIVDVIGARVPPEPCGEGGFLHCPGNYHALVGAPDDHTSPARVHIGDLVQGDPGEPDRVTHDDLGRSQPQPRTHSCPPRQQCHGWEDDESWDEVGAAALAPGQGNNGYDRREAHPGRKGHAEQAAREPHAPGDGKLGHATSIDHGRGRHKP